MIRQHVPWLPESIVFMDLPTARYGWDERLREIEEAGESRIFPFGIRDSDELCLRLGRRPPDRRHLLCGIAFWRDTDCVRFLLSL